MKKLGVLILVLFLVVGSVTFTSCEKDNSNNRRLLYPTALVTTKNTAEGKFYLQLDDSTTLFPKNVQPSPFAKKEVRAIVNYDELNETTQGYNKTIKLNWLDTIRTKPLAVAAASGNNDSLYGAYPLEIVKDWITIVEDGFLTLRFRTIFGYHSIPHTMNLVSGINPKDPYELELHQNTNDDIYGGQYADALIAFNLNSLPDTKGKTVDLTIKWNSFSGKKSTTFKYCTRKTTVIKAGNLENLSANKLIN